MGQYAGLYQLAFFLQSKLQLAFLNEAAVVITCEFCDVRVLAVSLLTTTADREDLFGCVCLFSV